MNQPLTLALERVEILTPVVEDIVLDGIASPALDAFGAAVGLLQRAVAAASAGDPDPGDLVLPVGILEALPPALAVLAAADQAGLLPTPDTLLKHMRTLGRRAMELGWEEEDLRSSMNAEGTPAVVAAPHDALDPVQASLQILSARGLNLLEGGTIEAADRATLLSAGDDLLSIAAVGQVLGREVPMALLIEASALRRRIWAGATPVVRSRLESWVEEQVAARGLGQDPVAAFFWAHPDAPARDFLPRSEAEPWPTSAGPEVIEPPHADTEQPGPDPVPSHAPPFKERIGPQPVELSLRGATLGTEVNQALLAFIKEVGEGRVPAGGEVVFPAGGAVASLPLVVLAEPGGVPVLVMSGGDLTSAEQGGERLVAVPFASAHVVYGPWVPGRRAGPLRLRVASGNRRWDLNVRQP